MSDTASATSSEPPAYRKATPWSVRKIVEQVTGKPIESLQDPAASGPTSAAGSPRSGRLEDWAAPAPSPENAPALEAFLPGTAAARRGKAPALPLTRPLPPEVLEEVETMLAKVPEAGRAGPAREEGSAPPRSRELERIYLSYLLLHLDKLADPALRYLRHAVEEECSDRGLAPPR